MAGGDSGFRCSSGETTEPDTKVPPVGEAAHSVVSEDRVLAPPTAASLRSAASNGAARWSLRLSSGRRSRPCALTLRDLEARGTRDLGPTLANDRDPDLASISCE